MYAGLELEAHDTLSYRTESDPGLHLDLTGRRRCNKFHVLNLEALGLRIEPRRFVDSIALQIVVTNRSRNVHLTHPYHPLFLTLF